MAARRPASTNPFRKSAPSPSAAPSPSSPPSASASVIFDDLPLPHHHSGPRHSIIRMTHSPADADGSSSDGSRVKTEKRVRVQSPPPPPPSPGSSSRSSLSDMEHRQHGEELLDGGPGKDEAWLVGQSSSNIPNIPIHTTAGPAPPNNPFSRTLQDMEQHEKQAQGAPWKSQLLNVDAFKRLLMTGVLGPSKAEEEPCPRHQAVAAVHAQDPAPTSLASAAISGQQSPDRSNRSRQASPDSTTLRFDAPTPSRLPDDPSPSQPASAAPGPPPTPTKKPKPPPPPSRQSRHLRLDSRDDATGTALGKLPVVSLSSVTDCPRQRLRDPNRPLPPIPIPAARPVPETDVAVGSLPPPLPRKQSRPEASVLLMSTTERSSSVDSLRSRADSVRGALAPAPPPPRRGAARKSISLPPASLASQQTSPSPTPSIAASASELERMSSPLSPSLLPPSRCESTESIRSIAQAQTQAQAQAQASGLAQHNPAVTLSSLLPPPPPPARNPSVRSNRPSRARREGTSTSMGKESTSEENTAPSAAAPPPPPPPPLPPPPARQRGGSRGSIDGGGGGAKRASMDVGKQRAVPEGKEDGSNGVDILADLEKLKSEVDAYRGTV